MSEVSVDVLSRALWRQTELEELVRHLALPYGDNEPVFAGADGRGTWDGEPLETARRLRELFRELVPGKVPAGVDQAWTQCAACGQWSCHRLLEGPGPHLEEGTGGTIPTD